MLDVEQNQVWRYLPGQGGYDSERTALLDPADLTDATELAVGQDVYVLDDEAGDAALHRQGRGAVRAGRHRHAR